MLDANLPTGKERRRKRGIGCDYPVETTGQADFNSAFLIQPSSSYHIMEDLPNELASTLQSAHIISHPDVSYDLNPSMAASKKTPVNFRPQSSRRRTSESLSRSSQIPLSVLEPPPRRQNLPPLPDMRFEQSYLARIKPYSEPADGGPPNYLMITWITVLDQVLMPLSQGVMWNLLLHGWRVFNTATRFQGQGVGAKIRRWWWRTNNWKIPPVQQQKKMAEDVKEFFVDEFGAAGPD